MAERKGRIPHPRWNYDFIDPNFSSEELRTANAPLIHVPRGCLFGIQTTEEYDATKRRGIEAQFVGLSDEGMIKLLDRHPAHVVALPFNPRNRALWAELVDDEIYNLAILDGHHRARYTPKTVKILPSLVMTAAQATRIYARRYEADTETFVEKVTREMDEALHSFTKVKDSLYPLSITFFTDGDSKEVRMLTRAGRPSTITSVQKKE